MSEFSKLRRDFKKQILKSGADTIELKIKHASENIETTIYKMKKIDEDKVVGFRKEAWEITNRLEFSRDGKLVQTPSSILMHGFGYALTSQYSHRQAAKSIAEKAAQAKCDGTFISLTC